MSTFGEFVRARKSTTPYYVDLYHQTDAQGLQGILDIGIRSCVYSTPKGAYFSTTPEDTFVGARWRGFIIRFRADISGIHGCDEDSIDPTLNGTDPHQHVWRLPAGLREATEIVVCTNDRLQYSGVLTAREYAAARHSFYDRRAQVPRGVSVFQPGDTGLKEFLEKLL